MDDTLKIILKQLKKYLKLLKKKLKYISCVKLEG